MPQPIMVVVPSKNGTKKSKTELAKSIETTMLAVNEILPRYTKVSTVVIAKEPFTIENGLLTPTLKVKRFNVHQKYASQLKAYCEHKDNVIWA
jgi:long-subunit acyl-CoA synthetase (AMP-forming)